MVEKNKLLSDLLDENCNSNQLDDLLESEDITESWYRYQTVSAIIRDQHSANASFEFCNQISAKIADEPAIIAAPKNVSIKSRQASIRPITQDVKRVGSGFAIAATLAVATFFSFQTLQLADENNQVNPQVASQADLSTPIKTQVPTNALTSNEFDAAEQYELDIFNDRYINDVRRSDKGNFAPVSGEFVRTVRFSAEEWQAILEKSLERQHQLEKARLQKNKE